MMDQRLIDYDPNYKTDVEMGGVVFETILTFSGGDTKTRIDEIPPEPIRFELDNGDA